MTEIDEGTKFAVQIMSAMHNGTTEALEGVIRDFCIESRTRQALLWLIRDKIIELANEDVLVHPKKYTQALLPLQADVDAWLEAHYDGDWRDYTTPFNRAGF